MSTCTTVDAGALRKALRLVHCIQKERGASCAASPAIFPARRDTDRAFAMLLPAENEDCLEKRTLEKIRAMVVELLENQAEDTASSSFHLILLSFNTLIQSLVHKYIVRYTEAGKTWAENRSQHTSQHKGGMVHSHSHHTLLNEHQTEAESSPLQYRHKRIYSTGASPILPRSDPETYGRIVPPPLSVGQDSSFDLQDSLHSRDYFESDDDEERVMRLLNLLDTFVSLKESTGRERATLSSILVQAENNLMMNDLVLEVENQRRQVDSLKRLLPKTGVWHDLVSELVSMSPMMKRLQNSIFKGFDLDSFRTTFDSQGELWNLLTLYINKLHSLELLIVEEIENCIGIRSDDDVLLVSDASNNLITESKSCHDGRNNSMTTRVLSEALGLSGGNLRQQIEAMSPDELKKRLLEMTSPNNHGQKNGEDHVAKAVAGKGVEDLLSELSKAPASKEWEIGLYELRFIQRIGEGSAGTTYLADWSGLNVAVKVASISEMGLEGWRTEVQQLQKLHHPNIIRLLGSVYHPTPLTFCLVLEYCDAGDLLGFLHKVTPPNFFFHVALSMAKGMAYLHSRGIIHRDIKPENVLLEGDVASGHFNVKVTDFGVATEASSGNRTAETGTYRWMAPEVIRHESYGQSADVYSAAVVMWQLITREEPFAKKGQVEAAAAVALENARPPFPDETPAAIAKLIETCWSVDPEERLPFDEIAIELQEIEKWLNLKDKTWIQAPLGHASMQAPKARAADAQELDISHVVGQDAVPGGKKKKGFRKILFNRKSAHF